MRIEVKAKPGSKEEKAEFRDGKLIVFLKEPAEKGKANIALIKLLSGIFGSARIVSGVKSKKKVVELPQGSIEEIKAQATSTS
ncbi:MAG: DUF167 domain-containing protein [Candidatus Aenigmarchaeota archaeon]|nr:DUF167 domain-containing protein [Candidatus Aenigmarchaeota archaeon]